MTNTKKILIILSVITSFILVFIGILSIEMKGDKILKNTYVNDVNIGGLTNLQAKEKLEKSYKLDSIKLTYQDKTWDIQSKDINIFYDINDTIESAYKINRDGNFINNLNDTIQAYFGNKNIVEVKLSYNEDDLKKSLETIAKDIDVPVQDAKISINGNSINVEDEKSGLKLNVEETLNNIINELKKGNSDIELLAENIEPSIKKEQLKAVDTILGSHTTKFNSSVEGRTTNIKLATNRTSDVLLMPGETFSYNEQTGKRSIENGYKNAPVIVQGVMQEGIGGGVCQVSTTLYNAVLYSGLELVNIKNHSIPSSYADKGRDATVTDSGIDFVFKNNYDYPVYIKNYVSGNYVTCQVYGSSKNKQNISISTSVDGVSVAPIKKVEDPTLLKGEEKELEPGRDGYTVSTYRIFKDSSGKVIKTIKVATSYYPKKQGVIAVGTKEEKPPEVETPEEPPVQPPVEPPTEEKPVEPPTEPPTEEPPVQPPVEETQPETNS